MGDRVKPGVTVPLVALGAAMTIAGLLTARSARFEGRERCDLVDLPNVLGFVALARECDGAEGRAVAAGLLVLAGLLLVVTMGPIAAARARRSAERGHPWFVRRLMVRGATWLDRRLPGAPADRVRIRPGVFTVALATTLALLAVGAVSAWRSHSESVEADRVAKGRAALAALELPAPLGPRSVESYCREDADTRCASATDFPAALTLVLESLVDGKSRTECLDGKEVPCGLSVEGTLGGYHAGVFAAPQLLVLKPGEPAPAGAVRGPLSSARSQRPSRVYWYFGTDLSIRLLHAPD